MGGRDSWVVIGQPGDSQNAEYFMISSILAYGSARGASKLDTPPRTVFCGSLMQRRLFDLFLTWHRKILEESLCPAPIIGFKDIVLKIVSSNSYGAKLLHDIFPN